MYQEMILLMFIFNSIRKTICYQCNVILTGFIIVILLYWCMFNSCINSVVNLSELRVENLCSRVRGWLLGGQLASEKNKHIH